MDADLSLLLLRLTLGVIFLAHGWNHGFGAGGLDGTTRWFASIGLRPARLHAAVSTYAELAVGAALVLGLLTPVAAAVGIGVMTTAFVTVHRANGFFIVKDGYEYVLLVAVALVVVATLGPGGWSLDAALDLGLTGWKWGVGALALGVVATAGLLAACWRPPTSGDR